ncbi:MAG: hypothetical protein EOO14_05895 [Chitinophagaceae bacterium]|nr:MAG: hypothetical protein EOO14_05895 [Chitinophagaceae bacterium]
MKQILPLLLFAILFASCSQYQYLTISGVNVPKNDQHALVSENDTLRAEYFFVPNEGVVSIRLYNKTANPLEINWRKSALIINGKPTSYFDNKQIINGQVQSSSWQLGRRSSAAGDLSGEIQGSEQTQFIPPQSYIESRPLKLSLSPVQALPAERGEEKVFRYGDQNTVKYKRFPFGPDNTPTKFRSYLTFLIGKSGATQEFSVEHQFYVSEVWKSASGPQYFDIALLNRFDRFVLVQ